MLNLLATVGTIQVAISEANGIPALIALTQDGTSAIKEGAARTLGNLATHSEIKAKIATLGGIAPLIALARAAGRAALKEAAATALGNLALNIKNKVLILEAGGILPLVALVADGNWAAKEAAAMAIGNLATNTDNQVHPMPSRRTQPRTPPHVVRAACTPPTRPSTRHSTATPQAHRSRSRTPAASRRW